MRIGLVRNSWLSSTRSLRLVESRHPVSRIRRGVTLGKVQIYFNPRFLSQL